MKKNDFLKKMLIFSIVLLFAGLIIIPSISSVNNALRIKNSSARTVAFNPFNEGWKYRKKITIDHTQVAGNLVNFPVLISTIDSDLHDKAQPDGDDILFMDDKGEANQLFHEIEYYDSFSGEVVAWVNIPALSDTVNIVFYMYYGNPNCGSQEFPEGVWNSDFIHVWHLGDSLEDSAGSDDGNDHGTDVVSGKIGMARDFEQNEKDFIDFGDMAQPADGSLTTITFEAWIKIESLSDECFIMNKYNTQGTDYASYYIAFNIDREYRNSARETNSLKTRSYTIDPFAEFDQWIYVTSKFNLGGVNDIVPFINGNEVADTQPESNGDFMRDISVSDDIGRYRPETGTKYSDAVIDEVRWSKVVRSDAWIKTSFNTMNDPSSFLSFGAEEKPRQKAYDNIGFLWFFERFPILQRIFSYIL